MDIRLFMIILAQQTKQLCRDNRLWIMVAILTTVVVASFASTVTRQQQREAERVVIAEADSAAWKRQGVVNPHTAAHFGHHLAKPFSSLSVFDHGILDYVGSLLRLEAHQQSIASAVPVDEGTALNRFAGFSPAWALQVLAPLLVLIAGCSSFSGPLARNILQQEMATSVSPTTLMLGRVGIFAVGILLFLGLLLALGVAVMALSGFAALEFSRLCWALAGYLLYLLVFAGVSLGVSANCQTLRMSFVLVLGFWIGAVVVLPVVAPSAVAVVYPTPPAPLFQEEVESEINAGLDGEGPREQRPERITELILNKYGVDSIEDLPVNFQGALLSFTEEESSRIYQEHFEALFGAFNEQKQLTRWFSAFTPLLALKSWSSAWSESDFAAQYRFLRDAERYRFAFVQRLNGDVGINRQGNSRYETDVAALTADLDTFEFSAVSNEAIRELAWGDLMILAAWATMACLFALASAKRLTRS